MRFRCPNCNNQVEILEKRPAEGVETEVLTCPSCNSRFSWSDDPGATQVSMVGTSIRQFEIRKLLGEGAFGAVYQAWDADLQRHVAIKIPRNDRLTKDSSRQVLREARAAAQIKHPHIVQVFEVGQFGEALYIVSEFIDGITLSEWMRIRNPTPRDAAALMVTICRGVQSAHDAGITHRDLKPANVLMDQQHQPHVTDFGLARRAAGADVTVTHDGRIVGTPSYMAPEQARGDDELIGPKSDVWALGVTFYELLTLQRPFHATSSHTVLYRILTEDARSPRTLNKSVPRDLETIVLKAMEKSPDARYASANAMADDLQAFLDGKPIAARPVSAPKKLWKLMRRHPVTAFLAVLVLLAPFVFLLQALLLSRGENVVAAPTTRPVRIGLWLLGDNVPNQEKATWAVLPLDKQTRRPDDTRIIRRDEAESFEAELEPGEYLVVVDVPNFGFHEVYRTVPDFEGAVSSLPFDHLTSTIEQDGTVLLPTVPIRSNSFANEGLTRITGATFEMGDDRPERARHSETVGDFLLEATEVTCDDYLKFRQLPDSYAWPKGDHPVVNQHWHMAVGYAEFMGRRLPTEAEFEYAATRSRTSEAEMQTWMQSAAERWTYDSAGLPAVDELAESKALGLHSNVAEWTDSLLTPYTNAPSLPPEMFAQMRITDSRVARGGPIALGANDRDQNRWSEPPTFRGAWLADYSDSEIGFRCARSVKARYVGE